MRKVVIMIFIFLLVITSLLVFMLVAKSSHKNATTKVNITNNIVTVNTHKAAHKLKRQNSPKLNNKNYLRVTKTKPKKENKLTLLKNKCNQQAGHKLNNNAMYFCLAKTGKLLTNDNKILKLTGKNGLTVAYYLAKYNNNWKSKDINILSLSDKNGNTVAHILAKYNKGYTTNKMEVLKLKNKQDETVAHYLALYSKTWTSKNPSILNLTTSYGVTVKQLLHKRGR